MNSYAHNILFQYKYLEGNCDGFRIRVILTDTVEMLETDQKSMAVPGFQS